jgi:hypothetical protein
VFETTDLCLSVNVPSLTSFSTGQLVTREDPTLVKQPSSKNDRPRLVRSSGSLVEACAPTQITGALPPGQPPVLGKHRTHRRRRFIKVGMNVETEAVARDLLAALWTRAHDDDDEAVS